MRIALKELLTFIILVSSTTIRRTVAAVPQKQSSNHAAREEEQKVPGGDKHRDKAIIVGGGPVGLASAIMLANRGYDVSIFEATTADEINTFNPSSAYLYNINTRGQTFTKVFPKLHKNLVERSVGSMEVRFMIVPGDTSKKIIYPNGMKFDQESFFITRHEMTKLLWEAVEDHNQSRDANGKSGYIQYELGVTCVGLSPSKKRENHISVIVKSNQSEEEKTVDGKLIVGADGIRSRVRESLKEGKNNGSFDAWDYNPKKFQLKTWKNPATGLKLKALQIPTQKFDVADSDGTKVKCSGKNFVFLRGIAKGPFDRMSLGSLPVKDSQPLRPATAITRPSHILWTLTSGEDVKLWMKDNFPRVDLDDLISNEEWERFAKARGLEFPPCQYSPALVVSGKHGDSGIVLLGDAAHSFSPDIGQGINAGLVDVVRFNETLSNFSQLGSALKEYERIQAPETRALIRIARFGAPYQYNQPLLRDKIGKFVHTTNLVLRLLLNKMTFGMFPKPMILSVTMDSDLTFRQVARRADLGTAALFSLSAAIILKILSP